jgi:hypothetical protein
MNDWTGRLMGWGASAWRAISPILARGALMLANALAALGRAIGWMQAQFARLPISALGWAMLGFLLLSAVYIAVTPPFEIYDELKHYALVNSISNGGLPVASAQGGALWGEHASQPLLYYALAALATSPIDQSDFVTYLVFNPFASPYDTFTLGNKHLLLTTLDAPRTQGAALAVMVLRALNALIALGTLYAVHRIGRRIFVQRPSVALLGVLLTAFNPAFIATSASVGNASLAIALNALVLWQVVRLWQEGFMLHRSALLALTLAIGIAVHLSALFFMLFALAVGVAVARRNRAWAGLAVLLGLVVGASALLNGWWFVRNFQLYGDASGLSVMASAAGLRQTPLTLEGVLSAFAGFRATYWGVFGVNNVALPFSFYFVFDLLTFVALFGVAFLFAQLHAIRDFAHARRELFGALLLLWVWLIGLLAYAVTLVTLERADGRLMFPFISALSPLLAAGLIEVLWWLLYFLTPPDRSYVRATDAVPAEVLHPNAVWAGRWLALFAFVAPLAVIVPTYAPPTPLEALPAGATPVYARYGDAVELVGYEFDTLNRRYSPTETVPITLYWRALAPASSDYRLSVGVVSPQGQTIGKLDTLPILGKLRTSTWQTGSIYADTSYVRLQGDLTLSYAFRVQVTLWDDAQRTRLPITDADGAPIAHVLLDGGVIAFPRLLTQFSGAADLSRMDARGREFGEARDDGQFARYLRLEQFSYDARLQELVLIWDTLNEMDTDYAFFAHVLDESGTIVGQKDVRPQMPTRFWRFGERLFTLHALAFPDGLRAGSYTLIVGVYDPVTMARLTLQADEEAPRFDFVRLFGFEIGEDGAFVSEELEALQPVPTPTTAAELAPAPAPTP